MSLPEYGQKHISELPLKNGIQENDSLAYDSGDEQTAFRIQFLGLVNAMLSKYMANKALTNQTAQELATFINKLSKPHNPDDGFGLVLRSHNNETQSGLSSLSQQLVSADAHIITDMFMESMTTDEFKKVCDLLAGTLARESSGTKDGTLANADLSNLTDVGKSNATKVWYHNLTQTSENIEIPQSALGKCVLISLKQDVSTITLPTSGLPTDSLQQVIIIIKRNGFNIDSTAFTSNGYTLRGTGALMPNFSENFSKDKAIEFFCEYDGFTNPENPTWNYGYSKIGH